MGVIFGRALQFISQNKSIFITLLLVIFIPVAFFLNVYQINKKYEKNIDAITYRKAIFIEKLLNNIIADKFSDPDKLQNLVTSLKEENSEIIALEIIKKENDGFRVIASSYEQNIGKFDNEQIQNTLAWNRQEGIAILNTSVDGRYWNVTKSLLNGNGEKFGLITMNFSLQETDAMIKKTISYSYWILFVTLVIVVLLVVNQARLIKHVLTLTKLKEVDKMKDMFISMASHELRSPLTAMRGYVELLSETESVKKDEDALRYMGNLSISVERLNDLVNDLLEVSRLEGNRLPIEISSFEPDAAIKQVVEELRPNAMQKSLILSYENLAGNKEILADQNRLKQVLVNLVSNAIKYTEKGSVSVNTTIKNNQFVITVADTGFGISSEEKEKLFQKFYRIQNEKTNKIIGTGLGLWITNEIVKRMNGRISVESIEGVGSHFSIHLPIASKIN